MATPSALEITKKLLREQDESQMKQKKNASKKNAQGDSQETPNVPSDMNIEGRDDSSEESASKQKKNTSAKYRTMSEEAQDTIDDDGETDVEDGETHTSNAATGEGVNGSEGKGQKTMKSDVVSEEYDDEDEDDDQDDDDYISQETDGDEQEEEEDQDMDTVVQNKMSEMKKSSSCKKKMAQDTKRIFGDSEVLTEQFKERAQNIFQAAVFARAEEVAEVLKETYQSKLDTIQGQMQTALNEQVSEIVENVDSYITYIAEEFVKQNRIAIDNGIRSEITENFISGLKNLFAESYIDVPDEKFDVLGEMHTELETKSEKLNESLKTIADLRKQNRCLLRESIILENSTGLSVEQKEKLKNLSEHLDFQNKENFSKKIVDLRESFLSPRNSDSPREESMLLEETFDESDSSSPAFVDPAVKSLLDRMGHLKPKR